MKTMNSNKSKGLQAQEHDNLSAGVSVNKDQMITDEIQGLLKKHNLYYTVWCYKGIVCIEIEWGDWKHDHLYCQHLMGEKGYKLLHEQLTEEDGSDCYSAVHTYIPKNATVES